MSKENDKTVLSNFTIQTLEEFVSSAGGEWSENVIESIQSACYDALDSLDWFYDDIAGFRRWVKAYKALSPKDRVIIVNSIDDAFAKDLRKTISKLREENRKLIAKINGETIPSLKRTALEQRQEDMYVLFGDEFPRENKLLHALHGLRMEVLPTTRTGAKKPPSKIKFCRAMLFESLYRIYKDDIKLTLIETENGEFWEFLMTILGDTALTVFEVNDLRKEIRKAKGQQENMHKPKQTARGLFIDD